MRSKAVKRKRIHEGIVAKIREQLAAGRWKPGDRLPSERDFSERFRVSRASVREAIRTLESVGLLTIRTGEGTFVASKAAASLPLVSVLLQQKNALLDIFEARRAIEPEIAALAAERATPDEIQQLHAILEAQSRQIEKGGTGVDEDTAFHSLLTQSTKNKVFLRLNDAIVDSLRETRERSLNTPGRPQRSLAGHRAIVNALIARDPAAARRAMRKHLGAIEMNVLEPTRNARAGGNMRGKGEGSAGIAVRRLAGHDATGGGA